MTDKDYEIGFKKPPKDTQFKKGQSGNPKGRPKGVKNLSTDLQEELEEKVLITEANKTYEVTKQRALFKTLFAKALKGDTRAAHVLINLILGLEQAKSQQGDHEELSADDAAILAAYFEKFKQDHNDE